MMRFTALVSALALSTAAPALGQTVDLRPKFVVGTQARVTVTLEASQTMVGQMGMGDITSASRQGVVLAERVTESDPAKGATVELTYERVVVQINNPGDPVDLDTANPKEPRQRDPNDLMSMTAMSEAMIAPHIKQLIGKKLTLKFEPSGKLVGVSGTGDTGVIGVMGPIAGLSAETAVFARLYGPMSMMDPAKAAAVSVGESWEFKQDTMSPSVGQVKLVATLTLRSADADRATVVGVGKYEPGEGGMMMGTIKASSIDGEMLWDVRASRMLSLVTNQAMEVESGGGYGVPGMMSRSGSKMTVQREPMAPAAPAAPATAPPPAPAGGGERPR